MVIAQFTYFSQLTGIQGDEEIEQVSNIEVVNDGYVVWGGGANNQIGLFHFVRKHDFQGQLIDQTTVVYYPEDYLYSGIVNSFQYNPHTDEFVMLQGAETPTGVQGRMLAFNQNLDLVSDLYYDIYPPNTYFYGFLIEEDGYVITGEQGSDINSEGTFIAKLDFEGDVLWNEILQPEVYQQIYRNLSIIPVQEGYLLAGRGRALFNDFGILTKVSNQGNVLDVVNSVDLTMPRSYGMLACELSNGEILSLQAFGYEWVEEFGNPHIYWTKTRLRKLNPETLEFYDPVIEHFTNYEMHWGGVNKVLPTPDGGAIFVGTNLGNYFDSDAWLMKINSDGNEEWFKNVNYQTCNDCENVLYDIELAPDGGYIAAGYFINNAVDPRSSSWLVKVDACGDLEWQGCQPLSVPERYAQSFAVYPNPSAGRFTLESTTQAKVDAYSVYDLSGRLVVQEAVNALADGLQIELDVPSGFYTLQLRLEGGRMEAYKIQMVK